MLLKYDDRLYKVTKLSQTHSASKLMFEPRSSEAKIHFMKILTEIKHQLDYGNKILRGGDR